MELIFNKSDKYYVSEFQVTANFNLHIEKPNGDIRLYQRTAGGKYDSIDNVVYYAGNSVFDYDFNALVYPKFIKIVSETEPTYAEVVSDGEITEIKSQTKEVEVTANGTTQVAPDAGYSYLTGVTVKTNVPQSGGSGGSNIYVRFLIPENNGGSEAIGLCAGVPMGQIVCTPPDTQTLEYMPAAAIFADLYKSGGQVSKTLETTRAFSIISTDKAFIADKSLPIKTFDDFVDALVYLLSKIDGSIGRDIISQWFAEITEEEFYTI